MQGTWKEKTFGYIKDCKRKKQKRKHLVKEKIKPILNKYYYKDISNNIVRTDTNLILQEDVKFKYGGFVDIYRAKIYQAKDIKLNQSSSICDEMPNEIYKSFYKDVYVISEDRYRFYYDADTNQKITDYEKVTLLDFLYKKEIKFNEPIKISGRKLSLSGIQTEIFLYGRPLPTNFYKIYGFYSCSKRRSFVKKNVNKKNRGLVRKWISKNEFYNPIETHSLSKSIAWAVY